MMQVNKKKLFYCGIIILTIFLLDRFTKLYVLSLAEIHNHVDIFITSFLNIHLVWNKGIAFGLFSFNESFIYNIISTIIMIISILILVMITRSSGFKKLSLLFVFGGAIGNLFDRIYYSAVPDFIDFHINDFHWFVFNVADIFITLGIMCLILNEIFIDNKKNEKNI